jgi:hypothetical protein
MIFMLFRHSGRLLGWREGNRYIEDQSAGYEYE